MKALADSEMTKKRLRFGFSFVVYVKRPLQLTTTTTNTVFEAAVYLFELYINNLGLISTSFSSLILLTANVFLVNQYQFF